jgi:hypothetical protein
MTLDDFDDRTLCPDGACLGVLGPDGRCKVCGTQGNAANVRRTTSLADSDSDSASGADPRSPADSAPPSGGDSGLSPDTDSDSASDPFTDRELCPDDTCIGVLGSDRRCRVCGRSNEAVRPG